MQNIEEVIPADSFFKKYMECWPICESPRSFILLAAMSAFGCAIGRRMWVEMDTRRLYPMLNLVLTGPSGLGKTEAITLAQQNLLEKLPQHRRPMAVEGEATKQKLHEDLVASPHAYFIAEEMASVFGKQKYLEPMIPYVTELLNYKDRVERRTKNGDIVIVLKPSVTIMAGSTVDWLQKQLPDSAIGGGFLPRFLIAHEEHKSKFIPLPDLYLTPELKEKLGKLRAEVTRDFVHLTDVQEQKYGFRDYDAMQEFEIWATNHKAATGHLRPFSERAREFVIRLAMIMALSRKHKGIEASDVKIAAQIYEWAIQRLQQVAVPVTPEGEMLVKVLELFPTPQTQLTMKKVVKGMKNYLRAENVHRNVDSLIASGDLVLKDGNLRRIFKDKE